MMNTFAEQAKTFWKSMGPAGEPMALGIDSFTQMQRAYIQWLRQVKVTSGASLPGLTFDTWGRALVIAKAAAGIAAHPENQKRPK
jgi:hypothetical protein